MFKTVLEKAWKKNQRARSVFVYSCTDLTPVALIAMILLNIDLSYFILSGSMLHILQATFYTFVYFGPGGASVSWCILQHFVFKHMWQI